MASQHPHSSFTAQAGTALQQTSRMPPRSMAADGGLQQTRALCFHQRFPQETPPRPALPTTDHTMRPTSVHRARTRW